MLNIYNFFMFYFLDTNILLDMFDDTRNTSQKSIIFIQNKNNLSYSCSEDMVSTFFYVTQKNHSNEKIITFWNNLRKNSKIFHFGDIVLEKSFEYCKQNENADLEDVLQAFCAKENNCDALVTNDKKFVSDIIEIIHP